MGQDIEIDISKEALRLSLKDGDVSSSVSFGKAVASIESIGPARIVVSSQAVKRLIALLELGPSVTLYV